MKRMNEEFVTFKNSQNSAPAILAIFHFATGDVAVSDRNIDTGPDGPYFSGLVTAWGHIGAKAESISSIDLQELDLTLSNLGGPPFSTLLESNNPEGTEVDLCLWFEGMAYSNKEVMGRFIISSVDYSDSLVKLKLTCSFSQQNMMIGKAITRDDWPNADPEAIGKIESIVYGAPQGVPCIPVVAGAATTLVAEITADQTDGIELTLSPLETPFPSSGILEIEGECISYSGIVDSVLSGVVRGVSGTIPYWHRKGAHVLEPLSNFTYLAAGHPVNSIGNVYVDGIRVVSGITTNTNDAGKATIVFSDLYTLDKAVSLQVSKGSHSHREPTWTGQGSTTDVNIWVASINPNWTQNELAGSAFMDSTGSFFLITGNGPNYIEVMSIEGRTIAGGSYEGCVVNASVQNLFQDTVADMFDAPAAGTVTALCDADFTSFCAIVTSDGYVDTTRSLAVPELGTIIGAKLCCMMGQGSYSGTGRSTIMGGKFNGQYSQGGGNTMQAFKTYIESYSGAVDWTDFENMTIRATYVGGGAASSCAEQWLEVYYVPDNGGSSPASGVALSGNSTADFVVGKYVTCDLDGYADDANGTFTGSPGGLVQNPADVIKHFLVTQLSVPQSEIKHSFDSARASLSEAIPGGYNFAGVIDRKADAFKLLEEISAQARLKLYHDGYEARLEFLTNDAPTTDKTIGNSSIGISGLEIGRTKKSDVINTLDIYYERNFSKGHTVKDFNSIASSSQLYPIGGDPTSVALYGQQSPTKQFLFDFILNSQAASDLRDFYITRFKDIKRVVTLTLFLDNFELEPGDIIDLDYPSGFSDFGGAMFRVDDVLLLPGSAVHGRADSITVRATEV
ncbi:MAG: hypothetical protein ABSG42_06880 [Nitrospirota bacterium]